MVFNATKYLQQGQQPNEWTFRQCNTSGHKANECEGDLNGSSEGDEKEGQQTDT